MIAAAFPMRRERLFAHAEEMQRRSWGFLSSRTRLTVVTLVVCVVVGLLICGVGWYFYGPLLHMKYGLIDDHEILAYLGSRGSIDPLDIPHILATQTEVGQWGHTLRFRPVYYLLRVLEAAWHKRDAEGWYLVRIVLVTVTALGFAALGFRIVMTTKTWLRLVAAAVVAGATALIFLTLPAWTDIVTRLGPSEIYVAAGVMLFAWAAYVIWTQPERLLGWILGTVSFLLIVGSKEDGLIFLPVFALLYAFRFPRSRTRWTAIGLGVFSLAFSVYVALGFLPAFLGGGEDQYGNSRSIPLFLHALGGSGYLIAVVIAFVVALGCDIALNRSESTPRAATWWSRLTDLVNLRPRALAQLACLFIVIADLFFYQNYVTGSAFTDPRYGLLTEMAAAAAVIVAGIGVVELAFERILTPFRTVAALLVLAVVSPALPQLLVAKRTYRQSAQVTVAQSNLTYNQIMAGVKDVKANPDSQIQIILQEPNDYERIVGLTTFLVVYDDTKTVYLKDRILPSTVPENPVVAKMLRQVAKNGGLAQDGWRVAPSAQYSPNQSTICFYFGGPPANTRSCTSVHQITY